MRTKKENVWCVTVGDVGLPGKSSSMTTYLKYLFTDCGRHEPLAYHLTFRPAHSLSTIVDPKTEATDRTKAVFHSKYSQPQCLPLRP